MHAITVALSDGEAGRQSLQLFKEILTQLTALACGTIG